MAGIAEARSALERESIVIPLSEATSVKIIELAKNMFSKGFGDVELIGKVGDIQVGYINLFDAGDAESFEELDDELKLSLSNGDYAVKDGTVGDMATVQTADPKAQGMLGRWIRSEADYFNLDNEEELTAAEQIDALIDATRIIAESTSELEKLDFILRPTELHSDLLKALMEARGTAMERITLH